MEDVEPVGMGFIITYWEDGQPMTQFAGTLPAALRLVREYRAVGRRTELSTEDGVPVEVTEANLRGVID